MQLRNGRSKSMSDIRDILESLIVACDDYHDPSVISYHRDEIDEAEQQLDDYLAENFVLNSDYPEERE